MSVCHPAGQAFNAVPEALGLQIVHENEKNSEIGLQFPKGGV